MDDQGEFDGAEVMKPSLHLSRPATPIIMIDTGLAVHTRTVEHYQLLTDPPVDGIDPDWGWWHAAE